MWTDVSTPAADDLSSDLTVYAARLVRLVRREHAPSAGTRVLSRSGEHTSELPSH